MRRLLLLVVLLIGTGLWAATPGLGQVHIITPLLTCTVDNAAHSGALSSGLPGPIPTAVGNADGKFSGKGGTAPAQCP